jgi:hypothetical protein
VKRARIAVGVASLLFGVTAAACRPSSVADAEAKGDVAWLDAEGSAASIDAMGRLADRDAKAAKALSARAKFDDQAYVAAWNAVTRGARWGTDLLHEGLQDPTRAEAAARGIEGADPRCATFLPDAEAALTRLASGGMTPALALLLAEAGPPAHQLLGRRLAEKPTRGEVCSAIASGTASPDARAVLREVPPEARDDASCVSAVVSIAVTDDLTLKWLATSAEPGMLGAASRLGAIPCPRLHAAWVDAIAARPDAQAAALTVPLGEAMKRCPGTMDGVLADALRSKPGAQQALVGAIDPFEPELASLKATCATLPIVLKGRASPVAKERAGDALAHGCKGER